MRSSLALSSGTDMYCLWNTDLFHNKHTNNRKVNLSCFHTTWQHELHTPRLNKQHSTSVTAADNQTAWLGTGLLVHAYNRYTSNVFSCIKNVHLLQYVPTKTFTFTSVQYLTSPLPHKRPYTEHWTDFKWQVQFQTKINYKNIWGMALSGKVNSQNIMHQCYKNPPCRSCSSFTWCTASVCLTK